MLFWPKDKAMSSNTSKIKRLQTIDTTTRATMLSEKLPHSTAK
jgi:hypothetical protein